jgi:hypothetical protein
MAERVVIVCDVCGELAVQSVTFRAGGRSLAQDLCGEHLRELVRHSHAPKPGRRPSLKVVSKGAPIAAGPRGIGSPRPQGKISRAKPARERVTDPAVLAKRQAALAKARKALAEKRAARKEAG